MVCLAPRLWDDAQYDTVYNVLMPTLHLDLGLHNEPTHVATIANASLGEMRPK
jgi:hypothetical protein